MFAVGLLMLLSCVMSSVLPMEVNVAMYGHQNEIYDKAFKNIVTTGIGSHETFGSVYKS